jgi:hypothetical protein
MGYELNLGLDPNKKRSARLRPSNCTTGNRHNTQPTMLSRVSRQASRLALRQGASQATPWTTSRALTDYALRQSAVETRRVYEESRRDVFGAAAAAAALCLYAIKSSPTRCDEQDNAADSSADEDPYDNLPQDDEETNCSMCKTFRQGPCRTPWRKLERCFKDHENEEDGAVKCMKYFSPHQSCLMEYTNLYQLVSLDLKQDVLEDAEKAVTADERRRFKPEIDWSMWRQFVRDQGLGFKEAIDHEPVLISTLVNLPKQHNDLVLKLAYAVDQDGMALGLVYNQDYGKLVEMASNNDKTDTDAPDLSAPFELEFFVIPGNTRSVRVKALYAEDPRTAPPQKQILDAVLCESKLYSLKKIAKRALQE